jgi:hypothetical protein
MPPARSVKSRCGVHNLQQTERSAAIPQVVAVDLRGKNFPKPRFVHRNRSALLLGTDR